MQGAFAGSEASAALERDLSAALPGRVRFDRLTRTIYSTDASLYEILPCGVILPHHADDVVRAQQIAARHDVPIVPRGAGTGIAGGAVGAGLQIDFSQHMRGISDLDPAGRTVRVQPGVVLDELNDLLRPYELMFPVDVATSSRATLGGMIANNSCGARSVMYGRTVDYVQELTILLADGSVHTWPHLASEELPVRDGKSAQSPWQRPPRLAALRRQASGMAAVEPEWLTNLPPGLRDTLEQLRSSVRDEVLQRYPRVLRRNGGYALDRFCLSAALNPATLVIGSEGTLAIVLEAQLRLAARPRCAGLVVVQFPDVLDAVGAVPQVLAHQPSAVELMDHLILSAGAAQIPERMREKFLSGEPRAMLICEICGDDRRQVWTRLESLAADLRCSGIGSHVRAVPEPAVQAAVWELRKRGFGLLMSRPGHRQPHEFIEDAAVDPSDLRAYIDELSRMLADEGAQEVGYYAHASVGVIHVRPVLNLGQPDDVRRMARIAERTCELVRRFGGAFTGEHGDGLVRSWALERMYGPRIAQAFRQIKRAFDPAGRFNPGKIIDPPEITANLRDRYSPGAAVFEPHFDFGPHGGLAGMAGMCRGVGQCRQTLVGTMCPSYMATLDEKHTTRARALALRAALHGQGLLQGLDDPALHEVMDLCLQCKACKTECPTGVDMARLKSEWLAYLNQTRGVSLTTKFFGRAVRRIRWAARAPSFANFVLRHPLVRVWMEHRYGLDRRAPLPILAQNSFRSWFRRHRPAGTGRRGTVVYFVDTWTNHYWPQAGAAAVRLLEAAGFEVLAPAMECCGRPLISKGLLNEARRLAQRNIASLAPLAEQGVMIVGSEPSCILTLNQEWPELVRSHEAAAVAARVQTVEQLLASVLRNDRRALSFVAPSPAAAEVLLHGHCHQKALIGLHASLDLMRGIPGARAGEIPSGCCGMAGSFGHEVGHYDVARAVGEQRLFPAIRARGNAEIVVSGFSCAEQIAHHCGIRPRHLLEWVADQLLVSQAD